MFQKKNIYSNSITLKRSKSTLQRGIHNSKSERLSISNYDISGMKEKLSKIINFMNSYHSSNLRESYKLISNTKSFLSKKNLISSLKDDLIYHKSINKTYIVYEKYSNDLYKMYKQNYDEILKYKKSLNIDLKDFIKLMEDYENQKIKYIKERKLLIQSCEDLINYKIEEQKKLTETLNKLNIDLEKYNIELDELNNTIKMSKNKNENNLQNLEKEELEYLQKYEDLSNTYRKLVKQYNYYLDIENEHKCDLLYDENLDNEEENNADIQLQDQIFRNNYLKTVIKEIKDKMGDFEEQNQKFHKEEGLMKSSRRLEFNKLIKNNK